MSVRLPRCFWGVFHNERHPAGSEGKAHGLCVSVSGYFLPQRNVPLVSTPMFRAFTPLLAPPPHTDESVSEATDGQRLSKQQQLQAFVSLCSFTYIHIDMSSMTIFTFALWPIFCICAPFHISRLLVTLFRQLFFFYYFHFYCLDCYFDRLKLFFTRTTTEVRHWRWNPSVLFSGNLLQTDTTHTKKASHLQHINWAETNLLTTWVTCKVMTLPCLPWLPVSVSGFLQSFTVRCRIIMHSITDCGLVRLWPSETLAEWESDSTCIKEWY